MLSATYVACHYAECRYAECGGALSMCILVIVMTSVGSTEGRAIHRKSKVRIPVLGRFPEYDTLAYFRCRRRPDLRRPLRRFDRKIFGHFSSESLPDDENQVTTGQML
jgi:hypothetical protein